MEPFDPLCPPRRWTPHLIRLLAVEARTDPRTAQRWLDDTEDVVSTSADRLTDAYRRLHAQGRVPPLESRDL